MPSYDPSDQATLENYPLFDFEIATLLPTKSTSTLKLKQSNSGPARQSWSGTIDIYLGDTVRAVEVGLPRA